MKGRWFVVVAGALARGLCAAESQVSGAANVGIGSMSGGQVQVIHQGTAWEPTAVWGIAALALIGVLVVLVVVVLILRRPRSDVVPAPVAVGAVSGGVVQVGLSAQDMAPLIAAMTGAQAANAALLAAEVQRLNERLQEQALSVGAVQGFLATVKGKKVPPEQWPETFAELSADFFKLGQELKAIPTTTEELKTLVAQADAARQAGDLAQADGLLARASTLADQALDAQAAQYRQAARQSAAVLASRGTLALTRLERETAARLLEQAFDRRRLDVDSETLWWLFNAGDALQTAGRSAEALRLYRKAQREAEAGGDALRRDLAASHSWVGDIQVAQGDLAGALKSYQAYLEIAQTLARLDPSNRGWQRDLSVSHEKVGNVQVAQGDLAAALKSYQASLEIRQTLARLDPGNRGWQRDLSVSHNKVGNVQVVQGDLAAALKSYQAGLEIRQTLARLDPSNREWQRDLYVSNVNVGDVQVAQGDLAAALKSYQAGLETAQTLARLDPRNRGWQRDLSVSHNKVGDVQVAQGDLAAALKSYQAGLETAQTLARLDPGNREWQRDLSVSHDRVGDVQVAQGDLAAALKSYQASLEIRQTLARLDPGNAEWQVDVAVSCWELGQQLGSAGGSPAQRRQWLRLGLETLQRLHQEGRLAPNRQSWISMFENALAALK